MNALALAAILSGFALPVTAQDDPACVSDPGLLGLALGAVGQADEAVDVQDPESSGEERDVSPQEYDEDDGDATYEHRSCMSMGAEHTCAVGTVTISHAVTATALKAACSTEGRVPARAKMPYSFEEVSQAKDAWFFSLDVDFADKNLNRKAGHVAKDSYSGEDAGSGALVTEWSPSSLPIGASEGKHTLHGRIERKDWFSGNWAVVAEDSDSNVIRIVRPVV